MSDEDDLPPAAVQNGRDDSFGQQLGGVFGGVMMLAILFAGVGIAVYGIFHWMNWLQ